MDFYGIKRVVGSKQFLVKFGYLIVYLLRAQSELLILLLDRAFIGLIINLTKVVNKRLNPKIARTYYLIFLLVVDVF